jgi:RNA polymerase sigma factor for flagellar operon FliA
VKKTRSKESEDFKKYQHLVKGAVERLLSHYHLRANVVDEEDLYQIGSIALLNAIRKFDSSRNIKFETYAYVAIRNALMEGMFKFNGPFSINKDLIGALRLVAYMYKCEVSDEDICKALDMTADKLETLKKIAFIHLHSGIEDYHPIFDDVNHIYVKDTIKKILEDIDLSRDEKKIIKGKIAEKSFEKIGKELGFSREKTRQMYYAMIEKIREKVNE